MNTKNVLFWLLLIIGLLGSGNSANAQFSMLGKEFYTAFGPNSLQPAASITLSVDIVSPDTANIEVEVIGTSFANYMTIIPGVVTHVVLPNIECAKSELVLNDKAVKITSDKDIEVIATNSKSLSCDAWVVYPTSSLGTEYFTLNYPTSIANGESTGQPGEVVLVATADTTIVLITPADDLDNQQQAALFSIPLNKGDVYVLQGDPTDSSNDLTGSHIASNKPIAVISGHRRTEIPTKYQRSDGGAGSRDCLYEQLPPVNHWSDSVIVAPSATAILTGPDLIRIISATDHNIITIGDQSPGFLNKGEFYEIKSFSSPQVIKGSEPISVGQYTHSALSSSQVGDPSLTVGYALQQRDADLVFNAPQLTDISQQFLTVIIQSNGNDNIVIDGNRIAPQAVKKIGTGPFGFAQISLNQGFHTIRCSSPYSARVEGAGAVVDYAYTLPFDYQPLPLSVDKTISTDLTFYDIKPNPISHRDQRIEIPYAAKRSANLEWSIYDINGKEIVPATKIIIGAGEGAVSIQLPNAMITGTYFVKIRVADEPATEVLKKFVVE